MKKMFSALLLAVSLLVMAAVPDLAIANTTLDTMSYPLNVTYSDAGLPIALGGRGSLNTTTLTYSAVGTVTNDNAPQYSVGEVVSATRATAGATLTTATSANVLSSPISLTPGDWDCRAQVEYATTSATTTAVSSGISLTSATLPTQAGGSGLGYEALKNGVTALTTTSTIFSQDIIPVRVSIAGTTSVYLVANLTFSVGSATAYGSMTCRRMR